MELDALRTLWAEQASRFESGLRLSRTLLAAHHLDHARTALQRHTRWLAVEAGLTLVVVAWLGTFIYAHLLQPRFLLSAAALDAMLIASMVDLVRQIELTRRIDHGQPVALLQKRLEQLRMMRIRHEVGVLVAATLAWVLLLIVGMKALIGIDAWSVLPEPWLAANALLGAAMIPTSIYLSRRYAGSMDRWPWFRRLMDDIAGKHLREARAFLTEIAEFEEHA